MKNVIWILLSVLAIAPAGQADEFKFGSVGARAGFSHHHLSEHFVQSEAFADWQLPWTCRFAEHWTLTPALELTAGWLTSSGRDAFVGTCGPMLRLARENFPIEVVGGSGVTGITRDRFGGTDFGTHIQFTSHIGVIGHLGAHVEIGYRIQHMSNAGLAKPNPGLNLHMFSLSYRF